MNTIKPPFTKESALKKVQAAEDLWNQKKSEKIALAYTIDSQWRNRETFLNGRNEIINFLQTKWLKEQHYKLKKHLWSFTENRISVRFEYEWQDSAINQWYRTHGNEHWEFNSEGLMQIRDMSANDIKINASERKLQPH